MEAVLVGGIGVGEVTGPSVSIAPNPARQRFMVTISEAIIELAVNGIKGRTVCTLSPVGHTMVVDVLTLPPSLCFVTVTTDLGIAM